MKLKLGTRSSNLALIQAKYIKELIENHRPDIEVEIVKMSTIGDRIQHKPIDQINEKGVFVREIEKALILKEIDLAVHSMKDMPSVIDDRLIFVNPPKSELPEDVFVGDPSIVSLEDLKGKTVGTGSNRRRAQLNHWVESLETKPIRGNIETRMKKIETENLDGTILARSGLIRGGYEDRIGFILDPRKIIPSPSQGILAIEIRKEDQKLFDLFDEIKDPWATLRMEVERTYQATLSATCESPIGIYTELEDDTLTLYGAYAENPGDPLHYEQVQGPVENAKQLATTLAENLKEKANES